MSKRGRSDVAEDLEAPLSKKPAPSPSPTTTPPSESSQPDLHALLDFTSLTTHPEISTRFDQIASSLLYDYRISITNGATVTEFEILELECYLHKVGCHEDPFTRGAEEQRKSGLWYFHRAPRRFQPSTSQVTRAPTAAGGYRGGTRKGLDITFGSPLLLSSPYFASSSTTKPPSTAPPSTTTRGGVLFRTIRRVKDQKLISGPSLLVDEVLRLSKADSISQLVDTIWGGNISAFSPPSSSPSFMSLQRMSDPKKSTPPPRIHKSPRIGLDLSHPETTASMTHPRVVYVTKQYRYFTNPHLLVANGRAHTFLGVYLECDKNSELSDDEAAMSQELVRLTGLKGPTVSKYLDEYKAGYRSDKLTSFIGAKGKGASSAPATLLKMMGCLDRLAH
ncbi:hypothetical protein JAAARDRAFT_27642 [Jaapia argillacea MUCL 33604]|uniref:Uncharacterized protein n=1 Tax=Jaapia argillacea MUCL 33604 TaxID=933084 RepID=A0A067QCV7_9AGAM|nr:hypothetical protein JAAARDRAFT_27642 [Jaapia argillacea MUCL 33604]